MKKRFNLAQSGKHLDIYLYGVIGGWDVDLQTFMQQLRSVENPETVTVYLNTLGGSFYDGIPIFTQLGMLDAQVTVNIMGYALSMGSVIALVPGATVRMAQNGLIMHHRAQTLVYGSADDLQKEISILQKHEVGITKLYAQRLKASVEQAFALMQAETWYSADEALAAGLINEIIDPIDLSKAVNDAAAGVDANRLVGNYHNLPDNLSLLLGSSKKSSFFDLFNFKKPAAVNPLFKPSPHLPKPEETDMTEDQVKPLIKAAVDESNAALKADFETKLNESAAGLKAELTTEKDKNAALLEKVTGLETTLAEFEKPLPGTKVPPAGSAQTEVEKW